jgi:hypothetical protein
MGNPAMVFDRPILDFTSIPGLEALSRPGTPSCVWETKEKRATMARTVLDPIANQGHENLVDFIGKLCMYLVYPGMS